MTNRQKAQQERMKRLWGSGKQVKPYKRKERAAVVAPPVTESRFLLPEIVEEVKAEKPSCSNCGKTTTVNGITYSVACLTHDVGGVNMSFNRRQEKPARGRLIGVKKY